MTEINLQPQPEFLQQARLFLADIDEDWQAHIQQVGDCALQVKPQQEPYQALIRAIAHQQIHGKAAAAILGRFLKLFGDEFPSAMQIIQTDDLNLRECGFSQRKLDSIKGIAQGALDGLVPLLQEAVTLSDAELIKRLTQLKGVGQWTVEMLLIFSLGRMDILPVDDFGVRTGYQRLKKLEAMPDKKQLRQFGEAFQPYRSVAAWYLWRAAD